MIGTLGGLVELGGAGFRLPLLIGLFRFAARDAVILNKAMGLVVVVTALMSGADIKLAGWLAIAVRLPTMPVGFARYSRDRSFAILGRNRRFVMVMAAGWILGPLVGGLLPGGIAGAILLPALALILVLSAVNVCRHG